MAAEATHVLTALAFALFAVTVLFPLATLYLVALHLAKKPAALRAEAALLAAPLASDDHLPDVVVQLPCFNEGAVIGRALRHAAALDWPRERLHIQLLDDSTEPPHPDTLATITAVRAAGIDLAVLHRTHREAFKAGALRAGMEASPYRYFAILDADYVPEPDFLRRTMRGFAARPKPAFVQARFDYLNPAQNALTRVQRLLLDGHLGVEQATRSWAGHILPFNGTCGIWDREAIEAAGGWSGDTLAEDLDLSYRAFRAGRRGLFLTQVAVKGELPADTRAWEAQQRRWTKGFGQVARTMLPRLLVDRRLSLADRFAALLHLGIWWWLPVGVAAFVTGTLAALLNAEARWPLALTAITVVAFGLVSTILMLRAGNRLLRPGETPLLVFLGDIATMLRLGVGAVIGNLRATGEALIGRRSTFVRTPKTGGSADP